MNTTFMRGAFRPISLPKDMTGQNMFIAGEWCDAEDGATAEVIDPSCNEVIATTPKATIADVDRCVTASRAALSKCKDTSGAGKSK
jgi:acyl-CoA reductase-like NAD-dependent aldehyde dehydrogenase